MGKEQFKILPNSLVRRVNLILAVYFQIPKSLSNSRSRNTGLNTAARANKVMLPIVISWLSTLVHYMSICRRHVYIHMVCVYVYHKPNSSWSCRAASPTGWDFTVATESILHRPLPVPTFALLVSRMAWMNSLGLAEPKNAEGEKWQSSSLCNREE